jgi:hypothetical protein
MKNKKYHNIASSKIKTNGKIVERGNIYTPNMQIFTFLASYMGLTPPPLVK